MKNFPLVFMLVATNQKTMHVGCLRTICDSFRNIHKNPEKAFVKAKKSKREVISRLKRAKSIRIRSIL